MKMQQLPQQFDHTTATTKGKKIKTPMDATSPFHFFFFFFLEKIYGDN